MWHNMGFTFYMMFMMWTVVPNMVFMGKHVWHDLMILILDHYFTIMAILMTFNWFVWMLGWF